MRRFDATSAECLVFTYKEGLLSMVAHDLKIRVTRFTIDVDESTRAIDATFDAHSLRVVCAMSGTAEARGTLRPADKREIEQNIVREVLHAETYPEIRFSSDSVEQKAGTFLVKGRLTLHGRTRAVAVHVRAEESRYVAEARVPQPSFGIRPYSAMLGTLKVQPVVRIRVTLPMS